MAQLGYQIVQLCRAHRSVASEMLSRIGLHPGQEMILMHLWKQDGQNQTQLAQQMNVQAPTVTKMLQRLEQTGILKRQASSQDQRVMQVYLTEKGKALEEQVNAIWTELEQRTVENLNPEEQAVFGAILKKILLGLRPTQSSETSC